MKTIQILFVLAIILFRYQDANAQSGKENINNRSKTESVKVYGECGMCKKRIEKAALSVPGVQIVKWDEDANLLTVRYDRFKIELIDSIQLKVSSMGHDTEKYKASDAAYESLPSCCHYKRLS